MTPEEVISRLLAAGYNPTLLASMLNMPLDQVLAVLPEEKRAEHLSVALVEDQYRVLAYRVMEEAIKLLDEASPQNRMRLVMKFGGDIHRVLRNENADTYEEMRESFKELLESMRED